MSDIPRRSDFELAYSRRVPWDIPYPQPAFVDVVPSMALSVLDVGCGTGELALHVAATGRRVMAVDFLDEPIARGRQKAEERGISCEFRVCDALQLATLGQAFGTILDCGLFHVFSDTDRQLYVRALSTVLVPWGRLFMLVFSADEPGTHGPRRIGEGEFYQAFPSADWRIDSLQKTRFHVRTDIQKWTFTEGGPHAWFAEISRKPGGQP
jgi:ubiquinone/menaquinone biosynthesis C-methylase UbiE